jgi:CheY-like chemotaxis protein
MSRILLVDDSPHAQRIGERILTEEGFEVVTVSNADTALVRIEDVDPDVVIADAVMPGRTGYEICQYLKMSPRHRHVRVLLTAGVLEPIDEAQAQRVEADASIKKPFEASALVAAVRPLAEAAAKDREARGPGVGGQGPGAGARGVGSPVVPFVAVVDEEQVRAAVTLALDGAMDSIVSEISRRVVAALQSHPPEATKSAVAAPSGTVPAAAPIPQPVPYRSESVRRIHPLRIRSSILGLEPGGSEGEGSSPEASSKTQPPAPDPQ